MASLDEILNWGIPALLILVTVGFVWVKFFNPFVMPMLSRLWESLKGAEAPNIMKKKDIVYE